MERGRGTGVRNFSTRFIADRDSGPSRPAAKRAISWRWARRAFCSGAATAPLGPTSLRNFPSWGAHQGVVCTSASQQLGPKTRAAVATAATPTTSFCFRDAPGVYPTTTSIQAGRRSFGEKKPSARLPAFSMGWNSRATPSTATTLDAMPAIAAGYADLTSTSTAWDAFARRARRVLSGGPQSVLAPTFPAASSWPEMGAARAAGYGFRLPTYTEPFTTAIPRPSATPTSNLNPHGRGRRGRLVRRAENHGLAHGFLLADMTPSIRPRNPGQKWQAANLSGLSFTGVESSVNWQATSRQIAALFWTAIHLRAGGAAWPAVGVHLQLPGEQRQRRLDRSFKGLVARNRVESSRRYYAAPTRSGTCPWHARAAGSTPICR